MTLRTTFTALLTAAALAATGCGGDDKKGSSSSGASAEPYKPLTIPTDLAKKPAIPKTEGLPPEKLVVKDVVPGAGKVATAGGTVQVKYVGVAFSTDKEFDSNWKAGDKLLSAQLAEGSPTGVIKGWIRGIPGMKEGGRRLLVIPPDLGYGAQGSPPAIAPYETLVFVIDLKKVG